MKHLWQSHRVVGQRFFAQGPGAGLFGPVSWSSLDFVGPPEAGSCLHPPPSLSVLCHAFCSHFTLVTLKKKASGLVHYPCRSDMEVSVKESCLVAMCL